MGKLNKMQLLVASVGLLLINLLLTVLLFNLDDSDYQHLNGSEAKSHSFDLIKSVLVGQLFSIPLLSFLIGLIVAIFIDKNIPYSKRIIRGFLLVLTIVYGFFALMGLAKVITL